MSDSNTSGEESGEWYERWFGEEYLDLYAHRDDEEAADVVELIARATGWQPGDVILDLACGSGRHMAPFVAGSAWVTGLDLSMPLLRRARARGVGELVRGDIRTLPYADGSFHLVVNLFTSFGYFEDDEQHQVVLSEVARVLRRGAHFVLDFLHASYVRRNLVPDETSTLGERPVHIMRRLSADDRFIVKHIDVINEGRSYDERVRLFTPDELQLMLGRAALSVVELFGDYEGGALGENSDRAIVVARRR